MVGIVSDLECQFFQVCGEDQTVVADTMAPLHTFAFQEPGDLVELFFWHSGQDLLSSGHVTSQYCGLIFNHAQRKRIAGDIHVLIHHVDSALCWNIAEKRHRSTIYKYQRAPSRN